MSATTSRVQRRDALLEDAQFLRDHHEHPERAAIRLGVSLAALGKACERGGLLWPELQAAVKHRYFKPARGTGHPRYPDDPSATNQKGTSA